LAEIKGKTFGFVKHSSFGGLHAALHLLQQNGIDPRKDYDHYLELKTHDNVVKAVAKGEVEVGTVRTDTLERMAGEGKIKMEDFRVLNQVEDDFPFVHSTELYPEWPMAVLAHTDKKIAEEVGKALRQMKPDSLEAQRAHIMGWEKEADYIPVLNCLQAIHYNIFKKK
jgi:ABC-type phosphate/phosphonate transport system substrate-binding protein